MTRTVRMTVAAAALLLVGLGVPEASAVSPLTAVPAAVPAGGRERVEVDVARLRAEPRTSARVVETLGRGDRLQVHEERNVSGSAWHRVSVIGGSGASGWIRADLVGTRDCPVTLCFPEDRSCRSEPAC